MRSLRATVAISTAHSGGRAAKGVGSRDHRSPLARRCGGPAFALCLGLAGALTAGPSLACSYPEGFDQEAEITANMAVVTAIYEGTIQDVAQGAWHGAWTFTLGSTQSVWGASPPSTLRLTADNGACSNWFFLNEQNDEAPVAGTRVVIFATPQGEADNVWLYIARAEGGFAAHLFDRFARTPAGRQFREAQ